MPETEKVVTFSRPHSSHEDPRTERDAPPPLNLLIVYQNTKDAAEIAKHLKREGHKVTLMRAKGLEIKMGKGKDFRIRARGEDSYTSLLSFDGATLRTRPNVRETREVSRALRKAEIPVYQDFPVLFKVNDKGLSQEVLEANHVPTPRTLVFSYKDTPTAEEIETFIDALGEPPYVVKANRGSGGKQVAIVDSKEEAVKAFRSFHENAQKKKRGGALIQEFIESDPERRFDYRIQVVVGVNDSGELEANVVAVAKRLAAPGKRITNISQGADKIRVSLSEEEAHAFYVGKQGMSEKEFRKKLHKGDIEILSPKLQKVAEKAALAFGPGSTGVDVVVGAGGRRPMVLEVNSFPAGSRNFENSHGFSVYQEWARAFVGFVAHNKKHELRQAEETQTTWQQRVGGDRSGARQR